MKHHVIPVFSHCLVITTFILIVVTQSDAQMTLPYNGTTNTGFFAFRVNHLGTGRTAIYGKSVNGVAIGGVNLNQAGDENSKGSIGRLGYGVLGECNTNDCTGVRGSATRGTGVVGATSLGVAGVRGEHNNGNMGYLGKSNYGVMGESETSVGVRGESKKSTGVSAHSEDGRQALYASHGSGTLSWLASKEYGVYTDNPTGNGVFGKTRSRDENSYGVYGYHEKSNNWGYLGTNKYGVLGESNTGIGVFGKKHGDKGFAVFGSHVATQNSGALGTDGAGVLGISQGGYAGDFVGKVRVKVLEITGGSDLSEQFHIGLRSNRSQPVVGMVVSIDPDNPGGLMVSNQAYDRKVAGIISGAGGVNPGMVMAQENSKADGANPVALSGRVYCLADASNGAITPGDLLTTSNTTGHAMKVKDYELAQGAILGKAMTGLQQDRGLVLVLVNLQ